MEEKLEVEEQMGAGLGEGRGGGGVELQGSSEWYFSSCSYVSHKRNT